MSKKYIFIQLIASFIFLTNCSLYEKEERLLTSFSLNNHRKINVYYVDMGATASEVIQVRLSFGRSENDLVLKNFQRNYLVASKLLNDSTLFLIVKDTGAIKQDTSFIKIKM